jgi:hypothetical protein
VSATATTDALADARLLCQAHGLFITEVTDDVWDKTLNCKRYVRAFVVYRKVPNGRPARCGKRRDPAQLLAYVRTLI